MRIQFDSLLPGISTKGTSPLMSAIIGEVGRVASKGTVPQDKMLSFNDHKKIDMVVGGEAIYKLIVDEIKKAKKQILIQAFVWTPSTTVVKEIKSALAELKDDVDVFIVINQLDRIARMAFFKEIPPQAPKHDLESLGLDGLPGNVRVHVGVYIHNSPAANHEKAIVIDGKTLIKTGANFQHENYGPHGFYDAAMRLEGEVAKSAFYDFQSMWAIRTNKLDEEITPQLPRQEVLPLINSCPILYVTHPIRLTPALIPWYSLPSDPLNNAYLAAINHAERLIQIAIPNLNEPQIIRALADFINNKGGHIELLMGEKFNDLREELYGGTNQTTFNTLISLINVDRLEHLQARWFNRGNRPKNDTTPDVIHMKFMAIDQQVVIYGSANLDLVSLYNTHEANMVIDNHEFACRTTQNLFSSVFEKGIKVEVEKEFDSTFIDVGLMLYSMM